MKTVQVTGGEVTLRERDDLRVRDQEFLQEQLMDIAPIVKDLPFLEDGNLDEKAAFEQGLLTSEVLRALGTFTKAAIVARIASWTLEGEPPRSIEDVGDLHLDIYTELGEHVGDGLLELIGVMDFSPSDPKAPGFADTPTPASAP